MQETLELHVYHADAQVDDRVCALRLLADQPVPNFGRMDDSQVVAFYTAQAETVARGLRASLPQGTLARLVGSLIIEMAGIYRGIVPEIGA